MKTKTLKTLIFLMVLIIPFKLTAQESGDTVQSLRAAWFWGERSYPYCSVSPNLYHEFMVQKNNLRSSQGFASPLSNPWTCLGPTLVYGGGGSLYYWSGRVSCIAFDTRDNSGYTIFIGGASGGLWKTTNGGGNWVPKTDEQFSLASGYIAIDPNLNGSYSIIYYGTGEPVNAVGEYYGCGLLKSTNDGENWVLIDSASGSGLPAQTKFYKIAIRPGYPAQLMAALQTGLYRSIDAGLHWTKIIPSDPSDKRPASDVIYSPDGNKVIAVVLVPVQIIRV